MSGDLDALKKRLVGGKDMSDLPTSAVGRSGEFAPVDKPRLLDLFGCEGGAAKGYQRAGFYVVGMDIEPQPNYCGDEFTQGDAVSWLTHTTKVNGFAAIHASPPCQHYSDLAKRNGNAHEWPDLVALVRSRLAIIGLPYVIENVEGAPLVDPVMLCGTMFPGLRVLRHRLFESNIDLSAPPHGKHPLVFTHDKRKAHYGELDQDTSFVQVTGGGNATIANKRAAMGMPWASNHGLNEAIPPAYTEHIGRQLLAHIDAQKCAAWRCGDCGYGENRDGTCDACGQLWEFA